MRTASARARPSDAVPALVILFTCMVCVAMYVPFKQAYEFHSLEFSRATYYLSLDVCTNAGVTANLGPHNLCDTSHMIIATDPWIKAVRTMISDILRPLFAAVPRAVWALAVLGALALWCLLQNAARMAVNRRVYMPTMATKEPPL